VVRKFESLASESATLHAYLREIATFPSLTRDDERELGRLIHEHGDQVALGRLVQANLRTVVGYAKRFRRLGVPLLVDPKIPHIDYYAGATLVTPNHHEAETATHTRVRSEDEARDAARRFRDRARCSGVLMTRGDQGMWLLTDDVEGQLPTSAREVSDVTGAGDTVIATMTLAIAAGATAAEAARLANQAAGISVGRFGPATVSVDELLRAVAESEGAAS